MALSNVSYVADGVAQTYSLTFNYLTQTHVQAFVDGVEDTTFTWATSSTITLSALPAASAIVLIKRVTPTAPLVDFQDGSNLTEALLDTATQQSLFVVEESTDALTGLITLDLPTNTFGAQSKRISSVVDPVNAQDAVTKIWAETSGSSNVALAIVEADRATSQADIATTKAGEASTSAGNAVTSASTATTQAGIATTGASTATTQAGIATTQAGIATTDAGIATTKAGEASASASAAASSASEITALTTATTTVAAGGSATSSYDSGTGVMSLGLPTGATGAVGATFSLSGSVLTITTP
jgi:hypothetical protein